MSATGTNENSQNIPADLYTSQVPQNLKTDIALLRSLLKDDTLPGDPDDQDEPDLEQLLQKLETADGIARGVESRLDDIIDNLNVLLESLEAQSGEAVTSRLEEEIVVAEEDGILVEGTRVAAGRSSVEVVEILNVTEIRK